MSSPARSAGMPLVEDGTGRRPFMRGIMVHSLLSRGASFDEAFRTATAVRDKIRGRELVQREELAQMVEELLGEALEARPDAVATFPSIQVRDDRRAGEASPFSKGVLAQSLLAAAIDPDDAFAVARDIETSLLARRTRVVSRDELRAIAQETLGAKLGARVAQRYRAWRAFQETGKPLVLLLGGAAGVGKSALAQSVATRLGITRVYSTDAIRQVMRIMLSKELMPEIHSSSYDAHLTLPELHDSPDPVIEGFRAQATAVTVGVRAMIQRAIEENTSMIMEGVSILPGLVDPQRHSADAHVIFLAVSTLEREAFNSRFAARANEAKQRATHRYLENLDAILRIQDHILELAEAQDLPIVDNRSFDESVLSILRHVTESLRTQGEGSGNSE
ncbi:MAG TPA: ATP cone domain-containing protein [Myxococcota bacterium]|nr:ATP cone domain-containing protein [Myxococcota bacterium]